MAGAARDLIIIAVREDAAVRRLVARICLGGHPPSLILLGSRAERIVSGLAGFRARRGRAGLAAALLHALRRPDPGPEPALAHWGVPIREFERVNGGRTLLEILRRPGSLVVVAGCGPLDRAFRAVAGRFLVLDPASGPDALAEAALAALAAPGAAG